MCVRCGSVAEPPVDWAAAVEARAVDNPYRVDPTTGRRGRSWWRTEEGGIMQISVVGTGSMANAIIDRLIPVGHHVQVLSRDPQRLADSLSSAARTGPGTISVENVDQPPTGAVVILALPVGG